MVGCTESRRQKTTIPWASSQAQLKRTKNHARAYRNFTVTNMRQWLYQECPMATEEDNSLLISSFVLRGEKLGKGTALVLILEIAYLHRCSFALFLHL